MKVFYLIAVLEPGTAIGQQKRREGLVAGLRAVGHEGECYGVQPTRTSGPHPLRYRNLSSAVVGQIRARAAAAGVAVLIEGLPLAAALLRHVPTGRVFVDVC